MQTFWGKLDLAMNNARLSLGALVVFVLLLISVGQSAVLAQENVPIRGPKNSTDQFSGNVYGPITSDDTLWRIAERYRQNKNLSVYQVMVAIYDLNPNAFEQQNLNLMIDGATLKLPSERFIARYNAQEAQARAESDEQRWLRSSAIPSNTNIKRNIKPPSPPVNQDDLASTKSALEQQLKTLDETQAKQFDALREQFAQSINSVESLLQDNQKLYERIDKVNEDLGALRGQVDGDVKMTMDAQSQSISEMLQLLKAEQAQREQEASSSFLNTLKDPLVITIASSIFSFFAIAALGVWLLRRKKSPTSKEQAKPKANKEEVAAGAASMAPISTSAEEAEDIDDLSDDELFNDDDLLDDVLSSELEDSLDDELENFSDLSDEMLVPENELSEGLDNSDDSDDLFEEGDSELAQDDLDSLFSEDDNADDAEPDVGELEDDEFDISGDNDDATDALLDELDSEVLSEDGIDDDELAEIADSAGTDDLDEGLFESEPENDVTQDDTEFSADSGIVDSTDEILETIDEMSEELAQNNSDADDSFAENEDNEISIDDLLDETAAAPGIDEKLGLQGGQLDEQMLDKIDDEIQQQNQEIDAVADNLLNEIEQLEMMGGMLDDLDEDEDILESDSNADGIRNIDSLAEDLDEIDAEDIENADEFTDALSDDLISELQQDEEENVADELLKELSADPDIADPETTEAVSEERGANLLDELSDELTEELSDDLTDELLDELEAESNLDAELEDIGVTENPVESDLDDPLSDDLLDELSADVGPEDDSDEALGADVSEALLNEQDGVEAREFDAKGDTESQRTDVEELADMPGLDDWLSEEEDTTDSSILDELESTDFDELLHSIGEEESGDPSETAEKEHTEKQQLDNPDLDLEALFAEEEDELSIQELTSDDQTEEELISVDELLEDAEADTSSKTDEEFNLDVSLSDFTGDSKDDDLVDVDLDSGQAANLDLARAYIDMEDSAAAKDLLLSVLEKGTDSQKEEAQALLDELSDV